MLLQPLFAFVQVVPLGPEADRSVRQARKLKPAHRAFADGQRGAELLAVEAHGRPFPI